MSARRCVALSLSLLAAGFLAFAEPLRADEIEILELSPPPPATRNGIPAPPPGTPIAATGSNSVTVVVRYRLDGAGATINVYPNVASGPAAAGFILVPPTGPEPPCGLIRGPSTGRCAAAFALICSDRTPATVSVEEVGASLGTTDGGTALATDLEAPARYTFRCATPPSSRRSNCMVIGAAGAPGATPLPFGDELPICRCLRDDGAREFRCAILHPDFFLLRRAPIPLVAGRSFSEVWEFRALTPLDGPVKVEMTGAGLLDPVLHSFGAAGRKPGKVERFVVKGNAPKGEVILPGRASFKYDMKDAASDLERAWSVDRTIEVMVEPPR
jgi:hypothetical protein